MKTATIMTLAALIFGITNVSARADVFRYQLYEDSVQKFTPFVLTIEMDGKFVSTSHVIKMSLAKKTAIGSMLPLFVWDQNLKDVFQFQWSGKNTLVMKGAVPGNSFKSLIKRELSNPWGDTSINPYDEYSVWMEDGIAITPQGSVDESNFSIENMTVQESCLWGALKRI